VLSFNAQGAAAVAKLSDSIRHCRVWLAASNYIWLLLLLLLQGTLTWLAAAAGHCLLSAWGAAPHSCPVGSCHTQPASTPPTSSGWPPRRLWHTWGWHHPPAAAEGRWWGTGTWCTEAEGRLKQLWALSNRALSKPTSRTNRPCFGRLVEPVLKCTSTTETRMSVADVHAMQADAVKKHVVSICFLAITPQQPLHCHLAIHKQPRAHPSDGGNTKVAASSGF
jgi:hypothetical protein